MPDFNSFSRLQHWHHPQTGETVFLSYENGVTRLERGDQIKDIGTPPFDEAAALQKFQQEMGAWDFMHLRHLSDMAENGAFQEEGRPLTVAELGFPPELWQQLDAFYAEMKKKGSGQLAANTFPLLSNPTPQMRQRFFSLMSQRLRVAAPPADTTFHEQASALARDGLVRLSTRRADGSLWLPAALEPYRARLEQEQRPVIRPVVIAGQPTVLKNKGWESKLGGLPYWPQDTAWPTQASGSPLYFLAQIDLAQANAAGHLPDLPQQGLLQFFLAYADASYEDMQRSPDLSRPAVQVRYWPKIEPDTALLRQPPAFTDEFQSESFNPPEHALAFFNDEEFPSWLDSRLAWVNEIVPNLDDLEFPPNGHRLGGHAMLINASFPPQEKWRLLFQFDADDYGEQIYEGGGLGGWLGFFIRESDLNALDFSRVRLEMDAF